MIRHRRCDHCGKAVYHSQHSAKQGRSVLNRRFDHCGRRVDVYRCPDGGGWHIGYAPAYKPQGNPIVSREFAEGGHP